MSLRGATWHAQAKTGKRTRPLAVGTARRLVVSSLLVVVSGCAENLGGAPATEKTDKNWFTPTIAAQISAEGLLPASLPALDDAPPPVSRERAIALADAFVRTYGKVQRGNWSDDAKRAVDPSKLVRCERVDFVHSAYRDIPTTRSAAFRNAWGPQWLTRYCQDGVPVVEVSVAANAAAIEVEKDGRITSLSLDAAFNSHGVAPEGQRYPSLERAVSYLATQASPRGSRISALPIAIQVGRGTAPWVLSWRIPQMTADSRGLLTHVYGATNDQLRTAAGDAKAAQVDTLYDRTAAGDGRTIPVTLTRRREAISAEDVAAFLRQTRG